MRKEGQFVYICSRFSSKLWLTSRLRATERTDSPPETRSLTRSQSMARRGRPRILPLRFAVRNPAIVRICRRKKADPETTCELNCRVRTRSVSVQSASHNHCSATQHSASRDSRLAPRMKRDGAFKGTRPTIQEAFVPKLFSML